MGCNYRRNSLMLGSTFFSKVLTGPVSICCFIPVLGILRVKLLVSHISPLTKQVGIYERHSPVMGSTSSSHSSAGSIVLLRDQRKTPARNWSFHFSQAKCVSIVFYSSLFFHYPWCFSLSGI